VGPIDYLGTGGFLYSDKPKAYLDSIKRYLNAVRYIERSPEPDKKRLALEVAVKHMQWWQENRRASARAWANDDGELYAVAALLKSYGLSGPAEAVEDARSAAYDRGAAFQRNRYQRGVNEATEALRKALAGVS
jgi:hypothetical protein